MHRVERKNICMKDNNHVTIRYFLSVPHSHFSLNNLLCFKNEAVVDERPTIIASGC